MKKEFNVYSAELKIIDHEYRLVKTDKFIYKKTVKTFLGGEKTVPDPHYFTVKNTKQLIRLVLRILKYRKKYKEYFVLLIRTTKGQVYYSNLPKL